MSEITSETILEDGKFGMRPTIKTTAFLAWGIMLLLFIFTLEYSITKESVLFPFEWANPWIKLCVYIIVTGFMLAFALDKGSGAFFKNITTQLYEPSMSAEAKVNYVIRQIEKMTGIAIMLKESSEIKKNVKAIAEGATKIADKLLDTPLAPAVPPAPKVPTPAPATPEKKIEIIPL